MGHELRVDESRQIIVVTGSGHLGLEEMMGVTEQLMEEPFQSLPYGVVFDYRGANLLPVEGAHLRLLVGHLIQNQEKILNFNLSILTSKALEFGMARMFSALASTLPFEILVTHDEDEAFSWAQATGAEKGEDQP